MSWIIALYIYIVVWGALFSVGNWYKRIRGYSGHWLTLVIDLCWVAAIVYACSINGLIILPELEGLT